LHTPDCISLEDLRREPGEGFVGRILTKLLTEDTGSSCFVDEGVGLCTVGTANPTPSRSSLKQGTLILLHPGSGVTTRVITVSELPSRESDDPVGIVLALFRPDSVAEDNVPTS
jgi:hypothetical protein